MSIERSNLMLAAIVLAIFVGNAYCSELPSIWKNISPSQVTWQWQNTSIDMASGSPWTETETHWTNVTYNLSDCKIISATYDGIEIVKPPTGFSPAYNYDDVVKRGNKYYLRQANYNLPHHSDPNKELFINLNASIKAIDGQTPVEITNNQLDKASPQQVNIGVAY